MAKKQVVDEVPVFIPPLGTKLLRAEDLKGSPLTEAEVLVVRDDSDCTMMARSHAAKLDERRGYPDVDPENAWHDFQLLRKRLGRKPDLDEGGRVMLFHANDPELNQSVEDARATLDEFRHLIAEAAGSGGVPMVKTPVAGGEKQIFLWLTQARVSGAGFSGVVVDVPPSITSLAKGQRVEVALEAVVDWMVNDRGIIHGGFSLRVHRARLPEDRRAQFDAHIGATRFI